MSDKNEDIIPAILGVISACKETSEIFLANIDKEIMARFEKDELSESEKNFIQLGGAIAYNKITIAICNALGIGIKEITNEKEFQEMIEAMIRCNCKNCQEQITTLSEEQHNYSVH